MCVADGRDRDAREELLKGAMHAGRALSLSGLALGHAMAQALGGRFGTPHGAMNALCLPPALEFNRALAPEAVTRFGAALRGDAVERARELAQLGGFNRLRDRAFPRTSSETWPPPPRSGKATSRTHAPPRPRRSRRCCARSGDLRRRQDCPGQPFFTTAVNNA